MMEKITYKSPVDQNGKSYWVPIVIKNKDYLIGILNGMELAMVIHDIYGDLNPSLGSERFNDVLPDGRRISSMSNKEFKDHVKTLIIEEQEQQLFRTKHPDHKDDILNFFFQVGCTCGNFFGFRSPEDIPEINMECDWCHRILIHYTHKDDSEYKYDGSDIDIPHIIEMVKNELGLDDNNE